MGFDAIPEDKQESYPCPDEECQGCVTLDNGYWQCDECSFRTKDTRGKI